MKEVNNQNDCPKCKAENAKKWQRNEIDLNDKEGTTIDVNIDYCSECGYVFRLD
tara:strand:+ start:709 stop:870 length:162 start_codon:yes stop_codon:yes gene_type:complete